MHLDPGHSVHWLEWDPLKKNPKRVNTGVRTELQLKVTEFRQKVLSSEKLKWAGGSMAITDFIISQILLVNSLGVNPVLRTNSSGRKHLVSAEWYIYQPWSTTFLVVLSNTLGFIYMRFQLRACFRRDREIVI